MEQLTKLNSLYNKLTPSEQRYINALAIKRATTKKEITFQDMMQMFISMRELDVNEEKCSKESVLNYINGAFKND